ncbi:MAG: VCBS repeat-containing protein [Deltaproteobacteria bacterium]|jgi:hypothetical protein|nr:VCBS repeat-containing protein [Deltaproteobacteria bacterium]
MATGDLDGDEKLDLVTANGLDGFRSDVSVLLGVGNGTFQAPTYFEAEASPVSVAVADLDGDDAPDIVTANGNSNNVSVLLGNGDANFQEPVLFDAGNGAAFVALTDLDGDDIIDIVTANDVGDDLSVLLGNGDGSFGPPASFAAGDGPVFAAVGLLDGDDFPDVVTANRDGSNLSVLLGNGDGTFQAPAFLTAGEVPVAVAVGDLNGDERLDLATANRDSNDVSVLLGNGDGTFQAASFHPTGIAPVSVAIDVLYGETRFEKDTGESCPSKKYFYYAETFPDIITANRGSNDVSVLLGNGDGSFQSAYHFATGKAPVSLATFNINGLTRDLFDPDDPRDPEDPNGPPSRITVPLTDIITTDRDAFGVSVQRGKVPPRDNPNTCGVDESDPSDRFQPLIASPAVADEVRVLKVKQFCNAVDKNGEGITDTASHLTCYEIRKPLPTRPRTAATDQFGELTLNVRQPRSQICLRSALEWVGDVEIEPPDNALAPGLDHYELYNIGEARGSDRFEKREVGVEDIFVDATVQLKKPRRLGGPTGLSGSRPKNPSGHLSCYSMRPPKFKSVKIRTSNPFGTFDLTLRRPNLLCNPSEMELLSADR